MRTAIKIDETQWAALSEAITTGLDHAAEALSEMVCAPALAQTKRIDLVEYEDLSRLQISPGDRAVGIYLLVTGDVNAHMVLMLRPARAKALVSAMLGEEPEETDEAEEFALDNGDQSDLDEMARSALGEMGNVVGSSFLNHLAAVSGLTLMPSTPVVTHDMAGAILDAVMIDLAASEAQVLLIEARLALAERKLDCLFMVMPDSESLVKILEELTRVRE